MFQKKQNGFTLIMSMILLLVLTMLGLAAAKTTRLEMAMAGNMRNSDMSFQAAEVGLTAAEAFIEASHSKTEYNDSSGLISNLSADPDYFDSTTWDNVRVADVSLPGVTAPPKFIIKYLGDRSQNEVAMVNIGGYGSQQPGFTVSNFRVTAKGFGQTVNAGRTLQSYYGKSF